MLPESPINILAGFKLYGRKPKAAPAKIRPNDPNILFAKISEEKNIINEDMTAMPAANPSILSKRLKEFVTPTIHIKVNGIIKSLLMDNPMAAPKKMAI